MNDNFHKHSMEDKLVFQYEDTPNDNESDSPDSRTEGNQSENKSKKKYSVIPQSIREQFIKRVLSKEVTIKEAAKQFGLKFSTSKAILQTYKKEGRIGKKKNRERKTKVVNVVFVCSIDPNNLISSNVFPIISMNESKGSKTTSNEEENKSNFIEQTLKNYPGYKIVQQKNLQIQNDSNQAIQQYIKELGNEFLKEYIDKNFPQSKLSTSASINSSLTSLPGANQLGAISHPQASGSTVMNPTGLHNIDLNSYNNLQPSYFNGISNLGGNSYGISHQYSDMPQPSFGHYGQLNQTSPNQMPGIGMNQKRSFQTYEKDTIPDLELKNEQITEMSAKKFKSGEDLMWEFDSDRSKKELEDFIYKTHTAIKNNQYTGKSSTFDFSKYNEDFNE